MDINLILKETINNRTERFFGKPDKIDDDLLDSCMASPNLLDYLQNVCEIYELKKYGKKLGVKNGI